MDFKYSEVVDPSTYETEGLCEGIPLRRHKDMFAEINGAHRAQRDWNTLVSPLVDFHGGLGSNFTFLRVTVPECRPDRLEILSYANEFAFLYDGKFKMICRRYTSNQRSLDVTESVDLVKVCLHFISVEDIT